MTVGDIVLAEEYDYLIRSTGSVFQVISGDTRSVLFESTDTTDALDTFEYARDQMGNTGKSCSIKSGYYPFSDELALDSTSFQHQKWYSSGGRLTRLHALNDTPIIKLTGGALGNHFLSLYFTHNNASYSKSLISLQDRTIGNNIKDCIFYDFGNFKGYAVGMEILTSGASKSQYRNHIKGCYSDGFEAFKYYNNTQVTSGADHFISNNSILDTDVWNTKYVIKVAGVTTGEILAEHLNGVTYQYSSSNPLTSGEAVYKLDGNPKLWYWKMTDCMIWDIPAGVNTINILSTAQIETKGVNSSDRLGGSGASTTSAVKRFSWDTHAQGTTTTASSISSRDYTITHGLGKVPNIIFCTVMNTDTNVILPVAIPQDQVTTTTFKVRFNRPPPLPNVSGGQNLKFSWRVYV